MKSSRFRLEPCVTGEGGESFERVPRETQDGSNFTTRGREALSPREQEGHADLQESICLKQITAWRCTNSCTHLDKQSKGRKLTWHNREELSHSKFKSLAIAEGVTGYTTKLTVVCFFICKIRDFDGLDFWEELRILVS